MVTPRRVLPCLLDGVQSQTFAETGAGHIAGDPDAAQVQFVAVGADQLEEALKAHWRLLACGRSSCVTAILEPGRLREARDTVEVESVLDEPAVRRLFPLELPRVILTHTRPEPMLGLLRRLDGGPRQTKALGYLNRGTGLDVFGALFANSCTWAQAVAAAAVLIKASPASLLKARERTALADGAIRVPSLAHRRRPGARHGAARCDDGGGRLVSGDDAGPKACVRPLCAL